MAEAEHKIYRELSAEMRNGLKSIYQQISSASAENPEVEQTDALFNEASDQLQEVVRATETAAMDIMEIVEKQLDLAAANTALLQALRLKLGDDADLTQIEENNNSLGQDLTAVLTALSFQDITGQRIKKVMAALNTIESSVVDLYLSSGLVMEAAEKHPDKDAGQLKAEAARAVQEFRDNQQVKSELKGPSSSGVSQAAIDDMLSQLGL